MHLIGYVIGMPVSQFNTDKFIRDPARGSELEMFTREGAAWEACLVNDSTRVSFELGGVVTVMFLPMKSSWLETDGALRRKILDWENHLLDLCPGVEVIRVDDLLMEAWETLTDELWFRDEHIVLKFYAWLSEQPVDRYRVVQRSEMKRLSD